MFCKRATRQRRIGGAADPVSIHERYDLDLAPTIRYRFNFQSTRARERATVLQGTSSRPPEVSIHARVSKRATSDVNSV